MQHNIISPSAIVVFILSCASDDAGSADEAGTGLAAADSSCDEKRAAFVQAVQAPHSCEVDSDCAAYLALCLNRESGNCQGIFYTSVEALEAIEPLEAAYEQCRGQQCNTGGSCGLGPGNPTCEDGVCKSTWPGGPL